MTRIDFRAGVWFWGRCVVKVVRMWCVCGAYVVLMWCVVVIGGGVVGGVVAVVWCVWFGNDNGTVESRAPFLPEKKMARVDFRVVVLGWGRFVVKIVLLLCVSVSVSGFGVMVVVVV